MFYKTFFVWAFLSVSTSYAAEVYVCTDAAGKKSFQQMACDEGVEAELRKLEPAALVGSVSPVSDRFYEETRDFNTQEQLKRDLRRTENKINQYQQNMQRELAALQGKKRSANNNLAGAQWETSISNEMQAVTTKYNSLISTEQSRLDAQRQQLQPVN